MTSLINAFLVFSLHESLMYFEIVCCFIFVFPYFLSYEEKKLEPTHCVAQPKAKNNNLWYSMIACMMTSVGHHFGSDDVHGSSGIGSTVCTIPNVLIFWQDFSKGIVPH